MVRPHGRTASCGPVMVRVLVVVWVRVTVGAMVMVGVWLVRG